MVKRWAYYLAVLAGCLIFYFAYRQWMAWIVLIGVALLPLLSLALSLPAMLWARWRLDMPEAVTQGAELPLNLWLDCPLPPPRWQIPVLAKHSLTRKEWLLQPGLDCPTEHCGALDCSFRRGWVYDYMGLFRMPKKAPAAFRLWIRPKAVRPLQMPDPEKDLAVFWKPKPGGGFSENHELRLYRPGDSLRQIHWKLSGKTGQLIFREAMEISNRRLVLWLLHGGSPEELDRKLGRLLWLGGYLQRRKLKFDVLAYTGAGQRMWHIGTAHTLKDAMNGLLAEEPMEQSHMESPETAGQWQFYIGGEADEAP
jgi:uncharacterized protein (DUF58 family)